MRQQSFDQNSRQGSFTLKGMENSLNVLNNNPFIDEKQEENKNEGKLIKVRELYTNIKERIEAIKQTCSKNENN